METPSLVTQLLHRVCDGDTDARGALLALVYEELRRIAGHQVAFENKRQALQPTELVHEAYLRLFESSNNAFENRRHFFTAAASAMRRIRVDDARKRNRQKRGGDHKISELPEDIPVFDQDVAEVLSVHEALEQLEATAPRLAEIVMLRYFASHTIGECATILGVSGRTVDNDWRFARAWLHEALSKSQPNPPRRL